MKIQYFNMYNLNGDKHSDIQMVVRVKRKEVPLPQTAAII